MAKRVKHTYYVYDREGKKEKRESFASYQAYKKAYKKQAAKIAAERLRRDYAREKRRLISERSDIAKYRKLTREEQAYYKRRIAAVTLNKENRKAIEKTAKGIATQEPIMHDKLLNRDQFYAYYESFKTMLEKEKKTGDPMQYLVRQQAYTKSESQAKALLDVYRKEKKSYELWEKAAKYARDYGEVYEFTEEEQLQLIDPDDYIFYEFQDDYTNTGDIDEFTEFNIRTGEIELEQFIDYDKVKEKYHQLVDSGAYDSYGARAEIGRLYFGSK